LLKKAEVLLAAVILALICWLGWQLIEEPAAEAFREAAEGQEDGTESVPAAETESETESEAVKQPLPKKYDQRRNGRKLYIKDQKNLGTCWAVATSSALEAALLPKEHQEFSADHISMQNGYNGTQQDGGAYTMAMAYLTAWKGPVLESEDPYGDGYSPDGLKPFAHVQEIRLYREKDIEKLKRAVYEFGAVQSSIYMDMTSSIGNSVYYSKMNYAYCYPYEKKANHDILIIGWDDNYPASNFTYNVKGNGAFICQNSWGEKFGEDGIFYVSYEDAVLGGTSVAYSGIEATDNYDNLYQSDECGWVAQLGYGKDSCYFANAYTAGEDEWLEAAGFYATEKNTSYKVYVIPEFDGELKLSSAKPAAEGKFTDAGYYTVKLDEPVQLEAGVKFAVAVQITSPGSEYPAAAESQADEMTKDADLTDGEGYISSNGDSWTSAEEQYQCNLCLKAYTSKRSAD